MNLTFFNLTIFIVLLNISCLTKDYDHVPDYQRELNEYEKNIDELKLKMRELNSNNSFEKIEISECKKIYIGGKEICLPLLKGMKECYDEKEIKDRVDQFKLQGNTIHGYYLSDSIYNVVKNATDYFLVTDCYKVFSVNKTHNLSVSSDQLKEIFGAFTGFYKKNIYDKAVDDFDKKYEFISLDSPVLIEEYEPHKNMKSALILLRSNTNGKEGFSLMTFNLVVIKERLIMYSYYLLYNGAESIIQAKNKSDYYGLKLISNN